MAQITQETLNDMIATVNAGKQYDMKTWHEKFPEFGGDDNLVQSAMDYVATYNSGKYKSVDEINAKFPEFFPIENAEESPKEEKQSLWKTIGNSILSAGSRLLSQMNALGDIAPVANPYAIAADAGYRQQIHEQASHTRDEKQAAAERVYEGVGSEEDERLSAGIRYTAQLKEEQRKYAAEARKNVGEDATFTGLIKDGNIGGALELGMITAIESAPQMLMGINVPGRIALGTLTAADEYDRLSVEHPDMSVGARVLQSTAAGVLEQFWESKFNPLKIEGKVTKEAISSILRDYAKRGGKETLKDVGKVVLAWGKDMLGEGVEEVSTTISNDLVKYAIGLIDEDGEGFKQAYEEAKAEAAENGQEYEMSDFLWDIGKGLVNDFIGGAMAGGYMGSVSHGMQAGATVKSHIDARNEWNNMTDEEKAEHQAQANFARETIDAIASERGISRKQVLTLLDEAVEKRANGEATDVENSLIKRFNQGMATARQKSNAETKAENISLENETPKETKTTTEETQSAAGQKAIARPITIVSDGAEQQITFSGSKVVYNEDGSIDFDASGKIYLQDNSGNIILGNHEDMLEALNDALRLEKQNGDALLNNAIPLDNSLDNPLDNPLDNDAGDSPAVEASENAEVPAYPILEDGSPDFAQMTPEQQVAFAMENGGQEAVAETVQTAIEELNAQLESVGKKKGLVPAQRVVEKNRIRQEIAMWEQVAQQQSKEQVAEQLPEMEDSTTTDNQGNPIDANGALIVEQVDSIDELTNEDFLSPYRTIQLPPVSEQVGEAIGAGNKPVIIKKNILERNSIIHADLTPEQSKDILKSALYSPTLYGQNQKKTRPYNWVVINTKDKDGRNRLVLLEINNTKDNIEIVHWHYINERGLEKIKNQAEREDGQLLILPSDSSEEVGALSDPTPDIDSRNSVLDNTTDTAETIQDGKENDTATLQNTVSDGKGTKNNPDMQILNKENAEKVDLSADDVVLMHYRNGSIYRFCRKTEDGKLIPLDGGSIQTTRGGKETQWVEVEKKAVMYNGEKYYMLGSNPNSKTVNLVPVEATLPVMTNMKGDHSSVVQVEKSALTNEDGKRTFRNSEDNRDKEYAELRRSAKTLDDVLDYVVFWYTSGNGRVEYTLRDILRLFSTTDEDLNRIYVGDKKYIGVMDKFLHDAGMTAESKEDVEEILKKRMSEAAVVWSQMAEKEDKINNSLSLPKMIRAFVTMVNDNCRVKKGVRVVDYFAGRVEEKSGPAETMHQESSPLNETPAATTEIQEEAAESSEDVDAGNTTESEEQVIENEDLRLLMELEQKHKRTLEQLVTARERGNDDVAEMLLERANEIGKEIAELRNKLEFNIGHVRINEAAGRRTINYLKSAGVPIEEISEEQADEMIGETKTEELRDSGGILYGFTQNGKIYVINGRINPNTPVHEYTHLWANVFARTNPKRWTTIVSTLKQTTVWNEVLEDANYAGIKHDEQAVAREVLARLTGEYWGFINEDGKSRMDETFEKKALLARVRTALRSFWKQVAEWLGMKTHARQSDFEAQLQEFVRRPILDLMETNFDKKFKKMQEGLDKGGTNVLSLQQISELTDILEDDIRQGNRPLVFERIPHEALQSGLAEQRTLAETLTIVARRSRRQSRALARDGREVTSNEIASRDGSNTAMMLDLIAYAKEKGIWIEDVVEALDAKYGRDNRLTPGAESEVWQDLEHGVVIKAKVSNYYETMEEFLEGMILNNWLFNGNKQRIIGFGIDRRSGKDGIRVVYETPYVNSQSTTPLTQEEKDTFMADYGFTKIKSESVNSERKGESSSYTNGYFIVGDLHNMNIVRDDAGEIRCTDPIIRWIKGEHYTEQTKKEEQQDEWNETRLDEIFDGQSEYQIFNSEDQPAHAEPMSWLQRKVNAAADQANGIRVMQKEIEKITGHPITYNKDVREALEHSSSIIDQALKRFERGPQRRLNKVMKSIRSKMMWNDLWKPEMSDTYTNESGLAVVLKPSQQDILERYLMAKDNLERMEFETKPRMEELAERLRQQMGIEEEMSDEETLRAYVNMFESKYGRSEIKSLWKTINECTDFSLDWLLKGGLIGQELYDKLKQRRNYVPERDFAQLRTNDEIREEVDNRRRGQRGSQKPIALQKAEGGKSMAADIIANILLTAANSVQVAQENIVKRAMFDMMQEYLDACQQMGYPVPEKVWYLRDGVDEDGNPRYKAQLEKPSAEIIRQNEEVAERIRGLREDLKLFGKNNKALSAHITQLIEEAKKELLIVRKNEAGQASVDVAMLAGEEIPKVVVTVPTEDGGTEQYVMQFPARPEIANALNGVVGTKWEDKLQKTIGSNISALYTVYNPTFFATNLPRDVQWIITKGAAERGIFYPAFFAAEMARPATTILPIVEYVMGMDVDGRKGGGRLSDVFTTNGTIEHEFYQFLNGGGNTGYTQMNNIEKYRREVKRMTEGPRPEKATMSFLFTKVAPAINEFSELWTRFAVYRATKAILKSENATIRKNSPMSDEQIEAEALHDAKNFSTNFNRKAAGGFINFFNSLSMFSNAAIQGVSGAIRTFDSPKKAVRGAVSIMILPAFIGWMCTMLSPDDDEEEYKVPDYMRDNNIILLDTRCPLSMELIPWYRIGVNYALTQQGRRSKEQAIESIAMGFAEHGLPIPPIVGSAISNGIDWAIDEDEYSSKEKRLVSAITQLMYAQYLGNIHQLEQNKSWSGANLRNEFAQGRPQYLFGQNEAELFRDWSKLNYRLAGGDTNVPQNTKQGSLKPMNEFADINPKELRAYLGAVVPSGWLDIACYAYGITMGDEEQRGKDKPVANKFLLEADREVFEYTVAKEMKAMVKAYDEKMESLKGIIEGYSEEQLSLAAMRIKEVSKATYGMSYEERRKYIEDEISNNGNDAVLEAYLTFGVNLAEDGWSTKVNDGWKELTNAYTKLNIYSKGIKQGKSEREFIRDIKLATGIDLDENNSLDEARKILTAVMLSEIMRVKGIEHTMPTIQKQMLNSTWLPSTERAKKAAQNNDKK